MILLALLACTSPCKDADPTTLQIGTGEKEYTAVADGAAVDGVRGPQGGVHYEVAVQTGLAEGRADFHLEVWLEDQLVSEVDYRDYKLKCDGTAERTVATGLRVFPQLPYDSADTGWPDPTVRGEVEIRVTVTDEEGATVTGTTHWVIDP